MIKTISKSVLLLGAILIISFTIHFLVAARLKPNPFGALMLTYVFNFVFTAGTLIAFRIFIRKNIKQIGSVFLITSMIKFLLFFAVIAPFLKTDAGLKSFAFAAFFVPYAICLISEVLVTARLLKGLDENPQ